MEQCLTWLVRGGVAWYARGLGEKPEPLKAAQKEYVQENDALSKFIDEHYVQGGAVEANVFREAFQSNMEQMVSAKGLKTMMEARGFRYDRVYMDGKRVRGYVGLSLVPSDGRD